MKRRKYSRASTTGAGGLHEWAESLLLDKTTIEAIPSESVYAFINDLQRRKIELETQNERLRQMAPQDIQRLVRELEAQNRELRRVQEELRLSERKYRQLIENMQEGVGVFDTSARITFVNPRLAEMLGYTCEEMVGKQAFAFMDEYGIKTYRQYLEQNASGEVQRELEFDLMHKDGAWIHTLIKTSHITDDKGKFAGVIACVDDITDQVAAEEAAFASQKQVQALIDSKIIGIVIAELDGNIIEANDAFLEITGYSHEDIAAGLLKWTEITPPVPSHTEQTLDELFIKGYCTPFEKEFIRKDGTRIFLFIGASLWDTSSPNPVWVCFVLDISERKLAEEVLQRTRDNLEMAVAQRTAELMIVNDELQKEILERKEAEKVLLQKENSLRLLLEQTPVILWTTDRDLRVTSSTGASVDPKRNLLIGKTMSEVFRTDDPDYPPLIAHRRALEGTLSRYERNVAGKTFYAYLEPLRDNDGNIVGVVGAAIDISERKRIEEELKQISQRLVEAQEKERRNIARDLHDQISQSLALLKILLDKAMRSPEEKARFDWDETMSLVVELINQIRAMSLDLRPKMLDDLGLLPTLLWHFDRYTGQTHIRVDFKHAGLKKQLAPEVSTAAYRIVQEALNNVARHARVDDVLVRVWANGSAISVRIKDEGKGFNLAKLDPTVSTGLSGMRERVLLLGGKLEIETTVGKGTCITAQIPLCGWGKK